jgi:hypothetical protein
MTPYQSYCHGATQVWLVCNTKRMLCVAACSLQVGSDVLDVQMRHVSLLPRTPGANMATSAGQATAGQLGGGGGAAGNSDSTEEAAAPTALHGPVGVAADPTQAMVDDAGACMEGELYGSFTCHKLLMLYVAGVCACAAVALLDLIASYLALLVGLALTACPAV